MPLIKVVRKGVTPAVRKVPTSTAAAMLPMTLNRVSGEAVSETEDLTKVEDLGDAFRKFEPKLSFRGYAGPEETEFRSIKDFDPENLQKRQEVKGADGASHFLRNDLADLKQNIDLLYRLKDRWKLPAVRRAWGNASQREEIVNALGKLRTELERVAEGEK